MNYALHYQRLMDRAETRVLTGYFERHHVVPKCLDKTSKHTVNLTPEEHYVAHQLLVRMYPTNVRLVIAAVSMTMVSDTTSLRRNKLYGWLRRAHVEAISKTLKGRRWSEDERAAHGVVWNKGMTGGSLTEAHKAELKASQLRSYAERPERGARHSAAMKRHYDKIGRKPPRTPRPSTKFAKGHDTWNKNQAWSDGVLKKMRKPRSPEGCASIKRAAELREQKRREDPVAYEEFRARKIQRCKEVAAKKREADALLTPEQKLQRTLERLEKRIAKLEAQEAVRSAKGEIA